MSTHTTGQRQATTGRAGERASNPTTPHLRASEDVLTGREYLRVSQDRAGTGKSPDEQHDDNAARFPGSLHPDPYRDDNRSASRYATKTREDFSRLLDDLATGKFGADALVLWESSRGSRTVKEWVTLLDLCETRKVRIFVTTHDRTYDPTNGRDRRTLLEDAVDSEYESSKTSSRVRRHTAKNAEAGMPHGRILFGYDRLYDYDARGNRTFREQVIREDQATIVREAASRIAAGDSCYGIAKDLNSRKVPIPHKPINDRNIPEWNGAQIRRMLLNPGYIGKRVHQGKIVGDAVWPAILTDELFFKCQRILTDPKRKQIKDGSIKYLLSGILTCEKCGRIARVMPQRGGYRTYYCKDFCTSRRLDYVDSFVEELVIARLSDPEVLTLLNSANEGASDVLDKIEKKRTMLEEMEDLVTTEELSPASFARMEKKTLAEIEALEREAHKNDVAPVIREMSGPDAEAKWNAASLMKKREVIRTLFLGITMIPVPAEDRGKRGFNENLIDPVWIPGIDRLPVKRKTVKIPARVARNHKEGIRATKARKIADAAPALTPSQLDTVKRALSN